MCDIRIRSHQWLEETSMSNSDSIFLTSASWTYHFSHEIIYHTNESKKHMILLYFHKWVINFWRETLLQLLPLFILKFFILKTIYISVGKLLLLYFIECMILYHLPPMAGRLSWIPVASWMSGSFFRLHGSDKRGVSWWPLCAGDLIFHLFPVQQIPVPWKTLKLTYVLCWE